MDDNKENLIPSPEDETVEKNLESGESTSEVQSADAQETPEIKFETEGSTIFVKHEYNTKKPVKNGWKKRIGYCVIAVVLCGAIIAVSFFVEKLIPKKEEEPSEPLSSIEVATIEVLKYDDYVKETTVKSGNDELLTSINLSGAGIFNYYEEYSIMPYTEKVKVDDKETECIKWFIQGLKPEVTLTDDLYSHLETCMTISATEALENTYASVEEYHMAYGIDYEKPTRAFYVTFTDDTQPIEVLVGRQTASRDANYLTVRGIGDDTVYIVPATQIMNYDYLPSDFADLKMLDPIKRTDDNSKYFTSNELSRFDYIKISGTAVGGREIEFGMSSGVSADYMPYEMLAPYKRPADESFLENIIKFASEGLSADGLYSFKATDENKKACGFDDPGCVIEAKIGDYKFKLIVGGLMSEDSTGLSVMLDGKQQIFSIDAETFDFVTPDVTKMFNSDFIIENIYTIKGVTLAKEGNKYSYELIHTLREGTTNAYDTVVKHEGKNVHTDSFKALYQRVLLLSLLSFTTEAEKGDVAFAVTFEYIEKYPDKVVEFTVIEDDPYHYIAWVDGVPLGEVLKSSVTDITKNLDNFVAGGTVAYPL